jgi:threonine aldolase
LVGNRETIVRGRRFRKMFGGGMRQAGIIAAAALYALEHHVERLSEDHARARRLAGAIAELPAFTLINDPPDTNILIVEVAPSSRGEAAPLRAGLGVSGEDAPAARLCAALGERGVRVLPVGATRIRLVTHLDVDDAGIERAIEAFRSLT